MNELTQDQIDMIKTCGALNYFKYDTAVLAASTSREHDHLLEQLHDRTSEAYRVYEASKIKARFVVESAIFAKARSGDKDAVEMYMAIINRNEK